MQSYGSKIQEYKYIVGGEHNSSSLKMSLWLKTQGVPINSWAFMGVSVANICSHFHCNNVQYKFASLPLS